MFFRPKPTNQVFAISSGMDWLSTELSVVNHKNYHKINTMDRRMNSTPPAQDPSTFRTLPGPWICAKQI
jgi:hypothetical protein